MVVVNHFFLKNMGTIERKILVYLSFILLFVSAIMPDRIQILVFAASVILGSTGIKNVGVYSKYTKKYLLIFFLLFLFFIISAVFSQNINYAFDIVIRRLAILIIPLFAYFNVYKTIEIRKVFLVLFLLSGLFISIFVLFLSYNILFTDAFRINFLQSPLFYVQELLNNYKHRTYLNTYLLIALVFLLQELVRIEKSKIYLFGLILSVSTFILISGSRAGFLCLFFVWILWGISKIKTNRSYLFATVFIFGLFVTISFALIKNDSRFKVINQVEDSSEISKQGRLAIWRNSAEIMRSDWLFGVGLGDAEDELIHTYKKNNFKSGVEHSYNSHNQYIQLIIESGIISVFLILLVLFYPIWILKNKKNKWIWLNISLIFGLNLFFEVYLNRIAGVVMLALLPLIFVILQNEENIETKNVYRSFSINGILKYIVYINLIAIIIFGAISFISFNSFKLNSDDPVTYATQPYVLVNKLPGEIPPTFNSNTKGYRLDSLAVPILGNGYAYAYTKIGNRNVVSGDSLNLSVWFYADSSFNGDFLGISYGGNTQIENPFYQLKIYPLETWQNLLLSIKCKNGKAPAYFYFAKKGNSFNGLRGSVIFAKPKYEIIKSGKGEQ